jgi:hypothetical protein
MRNSKTRLVFGAQKHSEENKRDINQAKPQQNIGFLSERVPRQNFGILRSIFRATHRRFSDREPRETQKSSFLPFPMHGRVSRKRRNYD